MCITFDKNVFSGDAYQFSNQTKICAHNDANYYDQETYYQHYHDCILMDLGPWYTIATKETRLQRNPYIVQCICFLNFRDS